MEHSVRLPAYSGGSSPAISPPAAGDLITARAIERYKVKPTSPLLYFSYRSQAQIHAIYLPVSALDIARVSSGKLFLPFQVVAGSVLLPGLIFGQISYHMEQHGAGPLLTSALNMNHLRAAAFYLDLGRIMLLLRDAIRRG